MPRLLALLLCLVSCFGFGCATRTRMPALDQAGGFTPGETPIYLLTVTLKNVHKDHYQPELLVVNVEKAGAKEKADRLNFVPDDEAEEETENEALGHRYFVRLQTPPGDYVLVAFTGLASAFPFHGLCVAPLLAPLPREGGGIVYLGHVAATVRERQGNEFRAGPVIPLLDQSMTGMSDGTFDVVVEDRWPQDEAEFRKRFPALQGVEVRKHILPPFDRAKAQAWWEGEPR